MWKATFTSLWSRKLRLAMSTLAIVLGVSFVSGSLIFADMLTGSFNQILTGSISDVEVSKKNDAVVEAGKKPVPLDDAVIAKVRQVPGVEKAEGTVFEPGVMMIDTKGKAMTSFGPPQYGFTWVDLPSFKGQPGLTLDAGRAPTADDEIAVDPSSLEKSGHKLGDMVKVITPKKGTFTAKVVGTAAYGDGGTAGASYIFFTPKRGQQLFMDGRAEYGSIWITTAKEADRMKIAADVQKVLPPTFQARDGQVVADETSSQIGKSLVFVKVFPLIFAAISLLVAIFLIFNTFSILVAQRSKELALLRAMGASRRQVRRTVLVEAVVVGLVGSVAGLFLGVAIAMGIKAGLGAGGWDIGKAPITVSPTTAIVCLLTGTIVTLLAAMIPAQRATKISPVEAMAQARVEDEKGLGKRAGVGIGMAVTGAVLIALGLAVDVPKPIIFAGVGMALAMIGVAIASPLLGRPVVWAVGNLYRKVFGEVGKLAALNSVRQPRRTAATASALMVGLTLVSMMSIFGASATTSVTRQVTDTIRSDFMVGRQGFQDFPSSVSDKIRAVPEVGQVHALKTALVLDVPKGQTMPTMEALADNTGRYWSAIAAMDATSVDKIFPQTITQGRMFTGDGEMIVHDKFAEKEHIAVGDKRDFYSRDTQKLVKTTVVGIFSSGKGQPIVTQIVSRPTITSLGIAKDQDAFLSIYLKDGADAGAARTNLDKALADNPLVSVMDIGEYTKQILGQVQTTMAILYALLALSIIIAVLGIANTLGLSIIERTRELGLLRAIALTRRQVRRMITLESVVISLLGAVVGVGLGTCFGIVLQRLMANQGIDRLTIPWVQLLLFVVAAAVVGVLAALWPAHRAAKTDVLKSIAAE